jgi:hypothetical protein
MDKAELKGGSAEKNKALINRAATLKFQKRINTSWQGAKKVSPLQSQTERAGKKTRQRKAALNTEKRAKRRSREVKKSLEKK